MRIVFPGLFLGGLLGFATHAMGLWIAGTVSENLPLGAVGVRALLLAGAGILGSAVSTAVACRLLEHAGVAGLNFPPPTPPAAMVSAMYPVRKMAGNVFLLTLLVPLLVGALVP